MKTRLTAATLIFLSSAAAHRLDEYLQATTISLEKNRVQVQLRLTPGVAVLPFVMSAIDANGDGTISASEQGTYANRVLADLSLALNGMDLKLNLIQSTFPTTEALKEGLGEIRLDFAAPLPSDTAGRKLVFDNHHHERIAAYLVNCLVPQDPQIQVTAQTRNYNQSHYQLDYVQQGAMSWWWLTPLAAIPLGRLAYLSRKAP